jgi:hypothetical protein
MEEENLDGAEENDQGEWIEAQEENFEEDEVSIHDYDDVVVGDEQNEGNEGDAFETTEADDAFETENGEEAHIEEEQFHRIEYNTSLGVANGSDSIHTGDSHHHSPSVARSRVEDSPLLRGRSPWSNATSTTMTTASSLGSGSKLSLGGLKSTSSSARSSLSLSSNPPDLLLRSVVSSIVVAAPQKKNFSLDSFLMDEEDLLMKDLATDQSSPNAVIATSTTAATSVFEDFSVEKEMDFNLDDMDGSFMMENIGKLLLLPTSSADINQVEGYEENFLDNPDEDFLSMPVVSSVSMPSLPLAKMDVAKPATAKSVMKQRLNLSINPDEDARDDPSSISPGFDRIKKVLDFES